MTTYYVGPMGNDNNSGRTWETRLATLNGAEDKPVVAGDTVYIAPGVYRELLTCDVSGAAGSPITYIGDVTGEHTDSVGGIVRITGSNNDTTCARASAITASSINYRTFRGLYVDMSTGDLVSVVNGTNWIIEDCIFGDTQNRGIQFSGTPDDDIVRRSLFLCTTNATLVRFSAPAAYDDAGSLVENCMFLGSGASNVRCVESNTVGGVTIRNSFCTGTYGVRIATLNEGQTVNVENCIFTGCGTALRADVLGDLVEDYCTFWQNGIDRNTVNVGAHSVAYPALRLPPILYSGASQVSGFRLPWWCGELSEWSQVKAITGSNEPDDDLFGIRRPYTHGGPVATQCSWGPVQWFNSRRSDIRSYDGNLSMRQAEKSASWMFVPGITADQHTISVRNYRTAGYGGHRNPTMTIKQPGQADRVTEAGGAAGGWVQLSDTFTPAADPPWLVVEMRNNCDFTTTTTVSTTSTTTASTLSTSTQTVSTLTTTTTTLACDVWWDNLQVA